ncbi:MAG: DoxX family protein [Gemmatimonadota bacterium]
MDLRLLFVEVTSILLFAWYGATVLFGSGMTAEFERFGLAKYRRTTGALELLGALGLSVGMWVQWLTVPAATGLALLMVAGIVTRVRVGDRLVEMAPAIFLLAVNCLVVLWTIQG